MRLLCILSFVLFLSGCFIRTSVPADSPFYRLVGKTAILKIDHALLENYDGLFIVGTDNIMAHGTKVYGRLKQGQKIVFERPCKRRLPSGIHYYMRATFILNGASKEGDIELPPGCESGECKFWKLEN
jgi:hypothetical protein